MPNDSRSIAGAIADLRRRMADQDRLEEQLAAASSTPYPNTIVKSGTAGSTIDAGWIPTLGTTQIPILDHGSHLTGLTDDDHTQYLLASGTRALSGNWAAGQTRNVTVGTIGIGTTTPAYPLHVVGTASVTTLLASTATVTTLSGTTLAGTSVTGSTVSATTLLVNSNPLAVGGTSSITGTAVVTSGDQTIAGGKTFTGTVTAAGLTGTVDATVLRQGGNPLTVGGTSSITGTAVVTTGDQTISGNKTFTNTVSAANLTQNGTAVALLSGDQTYYGEKTFYGNLYVMTGGTLSVESGAKLLISTGGALLFNDNPLSVGGTSSINGTAVVTTGNQTISGVKTFSGSVAGTVNASLLQQGGNPLTIGGTSSINGTAVVTTGNQTVAGAKTFSDAAVFSSNTTHNGKLILGREDTTISSSGTQVLTVTQSFVQLTNSSGGSVFISEIDGYSSGMLLMVKRASSGSVIVFRDAGATSSSLNLAGDFSMTDNGDTLTMIYNGGQNRWVEIARSNN